MKNLIAINTELKKRSKAAIERGYYERNIDTKSRLLHSLMKSWYDARGNKIVLRQYLLKYDRKEYKSILECINKYYKNITINDYKGDNLDIDIDKIKNKERFYN